MWFPVGVRAKENDLVRLKALGNLARETANRRHGDIRRGIAVRLHVSGGTLFFGHAVILQLNPAGHLAVAGRVRQSAATEGFTLFRGSTIQSTPAAPATP